MAPECKGYSAGHYKPRSTITPIAKYALGVLGLVGGICLAIYSDCKSQKHTQEFFATRDWIVTSYNPLIGTRNYLNHEDIDLSFTLRDKIFNRIDEFEAKEHNKERGKIKLFDADGDGVVGNAELNDDPMDLAQKPKRDPIEDYVKNVVEKLKQML